MNDPSSLLGAQITSSAMIVFVWRFLEARFPKLAAVAPMAKRALTWLLAAVAAFGIHASFATSMNGETITIAIPTLPVLAHAAWEWIRSVAVQEWIHHSTK